MTSTTKKLTKAQATALEVIRRDIGRFPITASGAVATGLNTAVLSGLKKLGLIEAETIYLGGVVSGLRLV